MSRGFLICPEPIRAVTAGVGTRFLTLGRVLAGAGHGVTLAIPNDPAEAAGVAAGIELVRAEPDRLRDQARGHDWVLIQGHLGNHYLAGLDDAPDADGVPVVVDLYDPFLVENLHYYRELGLEPFANDHATWRLQLGRGDLFLCSSPEQRLYYLGLLTAMGRVNPLALADDPTLERLLVELPFGTPDRPVPEPGPRAEVLPEAGEPVLYFGGIYDWYDPGLLLEALPAVLEHHPRTTVVLMQHPHPQLSPMSQAARALALAEQRGWLGSRVVVAGWRPFDRRFDVPLVADLAVVTHRPGLETDLSLRTRLVDLLWLGLPVVVSEGGTMARVVCETGAGTVVPCGDAAALARAILGLLDDPGARSRAAVAGRRWAATRTWDRVAEPLLRFAEHPWRDPHRRRFAALAPGAVAPAEPLDRRVRRRLRRLLGIS
jgi:glycosyltransferase involved in cell wall biosynthesis